MALIEKETATHRIQIEFNEEGMVDSKEFLDSITSLGLLIRPRETKIKAGNNFRIVMQAHSGYSAEDFFEEHREFMDSFSGGPSSEN